MFGPGILRAILASLVVLSHTSGVKLGVVAVIAFFILSGYWVTRQYDLKYRLGPSPLRTFYLARFLRVWPAFAICLLGVVALRSLLGLSNDPDWRAALPLFGVATHLNDPLGVSWSLDIEMQFYLLAPLLIWFIRGTAQGVFVVLALVPVAIAGWFLGDRFGIVTVLTTLPAFAAGALLHLRDLRFSGRVAIISLVATVAALLVLRLGLPGIAELPPDIRIGTDGTPQGLIVGLLLTPLVGYAVRQKSGRFDRLAGDYSYSLYLVHFPVFALVRELAGSEVGDAGKIAMILLAYGVAAVFFVLVDRPIDRWRIARVERPGSVRVVPLP